MLESKNQFLQCTKLLMDTLQISNNDLKNIDALNELRIELKLKKQVIIYNNINLLYYIYISICIYKNVVQPICNTQFFNYSYNL